MTDWSHGLCNCLNDCGTCCITTFLPCITAGKNAEAMGESCLLYGLLSALGVGFITDALIRQKVREKYGITGSLFNDIVCHCCCACCSLVQEAQEIKVRGGAPGGQAMSRE